MVLNLAHNAKIQAHRASCSENACKMPFGLKILKIEEIIQIVESRTNNIWEMAKMHCRNIRYAKIKGRSIFELKNRTRGRNSTIVKERWRIVIEGINDLPSSSERG